MLDFTEIPPATPPSIDLDAFEKFAKDFFVKLRGAKVEKTVARGPDNGADIVIVVGKEKHLVSCKHYSDPVSASKEEDPLGRMRQWGCLKFIGFYSPGPATGLESKLRQTAGNDSSFKYEILDSQDIEREMIASSSAEGWLLGFRWFPKSFAKIATSLVAPLYVHSDENLLIADGEIRLPGVHFSAHVKPGDDEAHEVASEMLVGYANEVETAKSFSPIFLERLKDFAALVDGAFLKPVFVDDAELASSHIFPSWDLLLIRKLIDENKRLGMINLCRVWSLWDINRATTAYRYGELFFRKHKKTLEDIGDETSIDAVASYLTENRYFEDYILTSASKQFSFGEIARSGQTNERGYFAALLCFCPALQKTLDEIYGVLMLAVKYAEEKKLEAAARSYALNFSPPDLQYVNHKSPNLKELLKSLNVITVNALDELTKANPELRCLSEEKLEAWEPRAPVKEPLAKALGFGCVRNLV